MVTDADLLTWSGSPQSVKSCMNREHVCELHVCVDLQYGQRRGLKKSCETFLLRNLSDGSLNLNNLSNCFMTSKSPRWSQCERIKELEVNSRRRGQFRLKRGQRQCSGSATDESLCSTLWLAPLSLLSSSHLIGQQPNVPPPEWIMYDPARHDWGWNELSPPPRRCCSRLLLFTYLCVCLSVCQEDYSKTVWRPLMSFNTDDIWPLEDRNRRRSEMDHFLNSNGDLEKQLFTFILQMLNWLIRSNTFQHTVETLTLQQTTQQDKYQNV